MCRQPEGIYKCLLTISVYLLMPMTPAIVFGILSKRVTYAGAAASVAVGLLLTGTCLTDAALSVEDAQRWFPWMHYPLTFNYTYRGAWGTLIGTAALFAVSAFTAKTASEKLAPTTVDWSGPREPFTGPSDWRLQAAVLIAATAVLDGWLW